MSAAALSNISRNVPNIIGFGYSDKPTVEHTMDFSYEFFEDF